VGYNKGKNNPNYKHGNNIKHINFCIDCKKMIKTITKKTLRCYICNLNWRNIPRNNPNYKDGKYIKPHYCIDCNILLAKNNPFSKRCRKCYGRWRSKYIRGNKIANYINGKSRLPYPSEFSNYLKKQIKIRDKYKCCLCHINERNFKQYYNKRLEVHHIDYNKHNCKEDNLITLCKKCNIKANYNRDYWFAYFTYLIGEYYGNK
jgi:hypothetical protein